MVETAAAIYRNWCNARLDELWDFYYLIFWQLTLWCKLLLQFQPLESWHTIWLWRYGIRIGFFWIFCCFGSFFLNFCDLVILRNNRSLVFRLVLRINVNCRRMRIAKHCLTFFIRMLLLAEVCFTTMFKLFFSFRTTQSSKYHWPTWEISRLCEVELIHLKQLGRKLTCEAEVLWCQAFKA